MFKFSKSENTPDRISGCYYNRSSSDGSGNHFGRSYDVKVQVDDGKKEIGWQAYAVRQ